MASRKQGCRRRVVWAVLLAFWSWQASAELPRFEQPGWVALTPGQKATLAPLEKEWGQMDAFRRKKWLGIAQRFPDMTPEEQASLQRNMREWARLAPEERRIAREQFKSLRRSSPEEVQFVRQKWEEYSLLTDEEKERFRSKAPKPTKAKTPAAPPQAVVVVGRVATPAVPAPNSPLSPRKPPPQNPLAPPLPVARVDAPLFSSGAESVQ